MKRKPTRNTERIQTCRDIESALMDIRFGGNRMTLGHRDYYLIDGDKLTGLIALAAKGRRR